MKINIQEELARFVAGQSYPTGEVEPGLVAVLDVIIGYLQNLTVADWRVAKAVREIGPRLAAELNRLIAQLAPAQAAAQSDNKKDNVLYGIYDRIESLLIVAKVNQERREVELYQQLLDYIQVIYVKELNWIRMKSLGQTYNPYEYDGFVVDCSRQYPPDNTSRLEIVNELRAGFTCQGEIIRKPVVEFYE
jgi:hypothetical protein